MPYFTSKDGVRLFYDDIGRGRPLVLIHGWTFSGRFFHRNVPVLAENARVITVDLRGHGRSDKPDRGYRIPRLAADLRDLLLELDLRDVTLLGWSLGAPVIWSYLELFGRDNYAHASLTRPRHCGGAAVTAPILHAGLETRTPKLLRR